MDHETKGSERADDWREPASGLPLWQWAGLIILITLLAGAAFAVYHGSVPGLLDSQESVTEKIRALGMWGQMAIIGLMIIHSFVPFPAEIVALAAGACYGVLGGTALTWLGAMAGASLSFWLARTFGEPFVAAILTRRQHKMLDAWTEDQGAATLLISRFIPVIAFNLINYAAGLTKVGWWTFIWTTGLGILPLSALMVYLGDTMHELSWPWLFGLSAAGITTMAIIHIILKRRKMQRN